MTTEAVPAVADRVDGDRVDGRVYTDPTVYDLELRKIFTDGWVFVGHESEVPGAGDYVTRRLGRGPVIMVRDRHDLVHVMANRCAHRGVSLVQQPAGNVGSFHCIFHGWTYGLDGELRGVPRPGGMVTDRADCSLDRPGRVAGYRGFVFANQSGTTGSLEDHLGPGGMELLDWACDLSPTGHLDLSAGWLGQEVTSNWKMWAESDFDGYHLGSRPDEQTTIPPPGSPTSTTIAPGSKPVSVSWPPGSTTPRLPRHR